MNETRADNLITSIFSDLRVSPGILAAFVYSSIQGDTLIRLHEFIVKLISLWAGHEGDTDKTAHVYLWARNVDPYRED